MLFSSVDLTMGSYFKNLNLPDMPSFNYHILSQGFMVAMGITLATLASFITCLGLNLQKLSLCAPENEELSPWRQPKWVAGFTLVLAGSITDFLSFGMAPQSLLAPLAALSLVWNLSIASYLLDEKYNKTDIYAVALIFIGTAVTVIFANHEEKSFTLDELKALYHESRMLVYGFAVPILLMIHYGMAWYSVEYNVPGKVGKLMQMIGYAGFAGIVGGQSVLFAKSTVELIKSATQGEDVFLHLETYVIIVMMVGCLLTQITFLNYGLKGFDSLYVIPVYQSYWIISGVVGGLVYFGEWEELDGVGSFMFILGTCVTLVGLFVLTQKENHSIDNPGPRPSLDRGSYTPVHKDDETSSTGTFEGDLEINAIGVTTTGQETAQQLEQNRAKSKVKAVGTAGNQFKTM